MTYYGEAPRQRIFANALVLYCSGLAIVFVLPSLLLGPAYLVVCFRRHPGHHRTPQPWMTIQSMLPAEPFDKYHAFSARTLCTPRPVATPIPLVSTQKRLLEREGVKISKFHQWNSNDLRNIAVGILKPPKGAEGDAGLPCGSEMNEEAAAELDALGWSAHPRAPSSSSRNAPGSSREAHPAAASLHLGPIFVVFKNAAPKRGPVERTTWDKRKSRMSAILAPRISQARESLGRLFARDSSPGLRRVTPSAEDGVMGGVAGADFDVEVGAPTLLATPSLRRSLSLHPGGSAKRQGAPGRSLRQLSESLSGKAAEPPSIDGVRKRSRRTQPAAITQPGAFPGAHPVLIGQGERSARSGLAAELSWRDGLELCKEPGKPGKSSVLPPYFKRAEKLSALLQLDVGFLEPSPLEASLSGLAAAHPIHGPNLIALSDRRRSGTFFVSNRVVPEDDIGNAGSISRPTRPRPSFPTTYVHATMEDLLRSRQDAREAMRGALVTTTAERTLEWLMSVRCEKGGNARSEEVLRRVYFDYWHVAIICTSFFAWVRSLYRRLQCVLRSVGQIGAEGYEPTHMHGDSTIFLSPLPRPVQTPMCNIILTLFACTPINTRPDLDPLGSKLKWGGSVLLADTRQRCWEGEHSRCVLSAVSRRSAAPCACSMFTESIEDRLCPPREV